MRCRWPRQPFEAEGADDVRSIRFTQGDERDWKGSIAACRATIDVDLAALLCDADPDVEADLVHGLGQELETSINHHTLTRPNGPIHHGDWISHSVAKHRDNELVVFGRKGVHREMSEIAGMSARRFNRQPQ